MPRPARLISKIRTLAAFAYRHANGLPYLYPDPNLKYIAELSAPDVLYAYNHYECDQLTRDALNMIFILHADHEQNCSTSTVRMVGSVRPTCSPPARPVSVPLGPLHGGANVAVMEMLDQIHRGNVSAEVCQAGQAKESGVN